MRECMLPKRPADMNQLAKAIVDEATEGKLHESKLAERARKGGIIGGNARAAALPPEKRAEIARQAALSRWKKAEKLVS